MLLIIVTVIVTCPVNVVSLTLSYNPSGFCRWVFYLQTIKDMGTAGRVWNTLPQFFDSIALCANI